MTLSNALPPPEFDKLVEFCIYFGENFSSLLLEQLRLTQDKDQHQRLFALLVSVFKTVGDKPLVAALGDNDWVLVSRAVGILTELNAVEHTRAVARLLRHDHRKVREAAVKFLGKAGGVLAVKSLGSLSPRRTTMTRRSLKQ